MTYYAVVFLLRPPDILRCERFFERQNVCNPQENGVRAGGAAIANQSLCDSKFTTRNRFAKTFARYKGHLGPSGRKLQIEFENGFPGPFGPGAQKVQNGVEKESK